MYVGKPCQYVDFPKHTRQNEQTSTVYRHTDLIQRTVQHHMITLAAAIKSLNVTICDCINCGQFLPENQTEHVLHCFSVYFQSSAILYYVGVHI